MLQSSATCPCIGPRWLATRHAECRTRPLARTQHHKNQAAHQTVLQAAAGGAHEDTAGDRQVAVEPGVPQAAAVRLHVHRQPVLRLAELGDRLQLQARAASSTAFHIQNADATALHARANIVAASLGVPHMVEECSWLSRSWSAASGDTTHHALLPASSYLSVWAPIR